MQELGLVGAVIVSLAGAVVGMGRLYQRLSDKNFEWSEKIRLEERERWQTLLKNSESKNEMLIKAQIEQTIVNQKQTEAITRLTEAITELKNVMHSNNRDIISRIERLEKQ